MHKLSNQVNRKFIETIDIDDWQVETEEGFVDIKKLHKTVEYEVYSIKLENGTTLKCADTHILIDENYNEVFAHESLGKSIRTKYGISPVISVENLGYSENMYDLEIDSDNHTYYTNDILSHNTTSLVASILHYVIFNDDVTVALLANKGDTAREILGRIQLAYENLPTWLQQGIAEYNKGSMKFENNSRIIAAATSSASIRGYSCVTDDTLVCIELNNSIYYTSINKLINKNLHSMNKKYTVYKTINKINNKIYVGFHSIPKEENPLSSSESGSIFSDGYLGSGLLIKRAIEKYGPENFYQELLGVFETQEEAEQLESNIVDKEFTLLESTYNTNIGGNVRISYAENNGFYGRKHKEETKNKISIATVGNKRSSSTHNFKILDNTTGIVYLDFVDFKKQFPEYTKSTLIWDIGSGKFSYLDEAKQHAAIDRYNELLENRETLRQICRDRFIGKKRTEIAKKKASESIKKYIEDNKDEHYAKMLLINKNLEKIKKTADKHRGMKRSEKARKNMQDAHRGKIRYKNKKTKDVLCFWEHDVIPDGYELDIKIKN